MNLPIILFKSKNLFISWHNYKYRRFKNWLFQLDLSHEHYAYITIFGLTFFFIG